MLAGVSAFDSEDRQIYAAFAEMFGWPAAELVGATPPFVYWPPEEIEEALASTLRGEAPADT